MADDAVIHIEGTQHFGRHLAGIGAFFVSAAILGTHVELLLLKLHVGEHLQIGERRTHNHLAFKLFLFFQTVKNLIDQHLSLIEAAIHFPVSCNDFISHRYLILN